MSGFAANEDTRVTRALTVPEWQVPKCYARLATLHVGRYSLVELVTPTHRIFSN